MSALACRARLQGPVAASRQGPARAQQLLRQRPHGLASLATPARSAPRRAAPRTSAVATPEEPNYPLFSDERKEYSRKFARPVRSALLTTGCSGTAIFVSWISAHDHCLTIC